MNHAIEVTSLEKRYGAHKVLKGLTFSVRQGEIFALLGANGAGKTTTLECLEGLRLMTAAALWSLENGGFNCNPPPFPGISNAGKPSNSSPNGITFPWIPPC